MGRSMVHKLPLQKENVTDMDSTAPLLSWSVRRKIFFFLTICLPNSLPYVLCFAPPFFFFFHSSSLRQFSSSGISCNRPVQMVIDREYWGFVVALIANMESTALGPFLFFPKSLHHFPFLLYFQAFISISCLSCVA